MRRGYPFDNEQQGFIGAIIYSRQPNPQIAGAMSNHQESDLTWLAGPLLAEFPNKSTKLVRHGNDGIVVIHWEGTFTAFRNQCLHQEMPIHAGYLSPDGVLLCPWHNWCYDVHTGACVTVPGARLAQFPVRVDAERLWVGVASGETTNGNAA
jgi:nitrite reductase/ring-hydroxylating ferredoxin subunit